MTALLLLLPGTPLLFQGQEFGASAPFLYFADHRPDLAAAVARAPSPADDDARKAKARKVYGHVEKWLPGGRSL